jgi:hypothetical protein
LAIAREEAALAQNNAFKNTKSARASLDSTVKRCLKKLEMARDVALLNNLFEMSLIMKSQDRVMPTCSQNSDLTLFAMPFLGEKLLFGKIQYFGKCTSWSAVFLITWRCME